MGKLKSTNPMVKHGRFTYFNLNGKPIAIGKYSDNIPIGIWQYFDEEGQIVKQIDYNKTINYLSVQDTITNYLFLADTMPIFQNEIYSDFREYLSENIIFPINSVKDNVNERVWARFFINKEGFLVSPVIVKGENYDLNIEIMRVLYESPKWIPGYYKGELFNFRYTYPIKFEIE